ncbi:hypothetical protein HKBW3S42_01511, partial [Candidatus Hakubella thermalkaliphila]
GFVSEILGRERGIYVGLGNSILLLGTVLVLVLVSRRKSLLRKVESKSQAL